VEAKDLYENRRRDIAALLGWLDLEVDQHAAYAETEGGPNYAHAGDLGHVRERLIETLAFLAQRDGKDIKEALVDAAAGREQNEGKTTD